MIKLTNILNRVILEQVSNASVQNIYNNIIRAVKGPGTAVDKLISAVNQLKTSDEFEILNKMFADNKTGYDSFDNMINGEFNDGIFGRISAKTSNYEDAIQIQTKLKQLGYNVTFDSKKNPYGVNYFTGNFQTNLKKKPKSDTGSPTATTNNDVIIKDPSGQYSSSTKENPEIQQLVLSKFKESKDWYMKWIDSPITREKFISNWVSIEPNIATKTDSIFNEYKRIINSTYPHFYSSDKTVLAYVHPTDARQTKIPVYVNVRQIEDNEILQTMVHEMQHLLYSIKPLNPDKKVQDAFVTTNTVLTNPNDMLASTSNNNINSAVNANISKAANEMGVDDNYIRIWQNIYSNQSRDKNVYIGDPTENMSRIMAIRNKFGLIAGQNITPQMLKPYLLRQKNDSDIYWLLNYWAKTGFKDINQLLNNINALALKTPDKPKPGITKPAPTQNVDNVLRKDYNNNIA